jgi:hypothetical protein
MKSKIKIRYCEFCGIDRPRKNIVRGWKRVYDEDYCPKCLNQSADECAEKMQEVEEREMIIMRVSFVPKKLAKKKKS